MNLYGVNLNLYTSLTFADTFSLTAVTLCHIFTYQTRCGLSFYRDLFILLLNSKRDKYFWKNENVKCYYIRDGIRM